MDAGNKKMILSYCELLMTLGHDVHFLCVTTTPFNKKLRENLYNAYECTKKYWGNKYHEFHLNWIQNFWNSTLPHIHKLGSGYWNVDDDYPLGLTKHINSLNDKYHFGACIVNYVFLSKAICGINIPKSAIFTHDHFTYKNLLTGISKCYKSLRPNEEARGLQRAKHLFAMQDEEAALFKALSPQSNIYVNYCLFDYTEQPVTNSHNIMFLSGDNIYNLNGFLWFLNKVLPVILQKIEDVKVLVGGSICEELKSWNLPDCIQLLGFVDNPSVFFSKGDVAINPTYQGTGLKIKTFESLSYDKITLVHPHSTKGIFKKDTAPLFASSNPEDWANWLYDIWSNPNKIKDIKNRIRVYIYEMNNFIVEEYKRFLAD